MRTRAALVAERVAAGASRRLGRGSGEVIGGKVALAISPSAVKELAAGRRTACVSATNGKTTTTRLLAAALASKGSVASNSGGANMTAGVLAALNKDRATDFAALEVDEIYLPRVARDVSPQVVVLLNISRDQLDRSNETRRIASMWRALGTELSDCTAVANADDPLVVWAGLGFASTVWVSAGQSWTADAMVCPSCAALLHRTADDWWCDCGLRRPAATVTVPDLRTVVVDGTSHELSLALPGRCNASNAAMAAAAAQLLGVPVAQALEAMACVEGVEGRYSQIAIAPGRSGRLLLAKNPAGWLEMLELLQEGPVRPCLLAFNSRVADGRDPSWIWDVPLEMLRGRPVVVFGERAHDLSVRLAYAGVEHEVVTDLAAAARSTEGDVDVIANYTAFRALIGAGP